MVKSSSRYGRFLSLLAHYLDIYSYKPNFYKVISEMKRDRNVNILVMLVLLVAVGQMAQTIYIPAIAQMANDLNVREGAVQSVMATESDAARSFWSGCRFSCWPRWSLSPLTA